MIYIFQNVLEIFLNTPFAFLFYDPNIKSWEKRKRGENKVVTCQSPLFSKKKFQKNFPIIYESNHFSNHNESNNLEFERAMNAAVNFAVSGNEQHTNKMGLSLSFGKHRKNCCGYNSAFSKKSVRNLNSGSLMYRDF